jgi:hypothetical protein
MPLHRRTAPRVKDGRVQKQNNWAASARSIHVMTQREIHIERRDPGDGYRHLVTITQLRSFLQLLPDWDELTVGLDAIVLDGDPSCMGWRSPGIVALCAWERDLWWHHADPDFVDEHREILDLFDVRVTRSGGQIHVEWTEAQARALQLLNVLPHELGHHHDRITTKRQVRTGRGEQYAESYARRVMTEVWPAYARSFGV